ncbi:hypothetical protein M0R45_029955 [Rubus argutus]|uniref:Uncharacterized protein n=1 Tax=Rubus argutus TaxID=59490 RepID=A0AAW1WC32_RUBAR
MNEYVNDDNEIDLDEVPNLLKYVTGDPLENGLKSLLKRMSIDDQLASSTSEKRVRFPNEEKNEGSKDRWEVEDHSDASKEFAPSRIRPIAIPARDDEDGDVCKMEEDEPESGSSRGRTSLRRASHRQR